MVETKGIEPFQPPCKGGSPALEHVSPCYILPNLLKVVQCVTLDVAPLILLNELDSSSTDIQSVLAYYLVYPFTRLVVEGSNPSSHDFSFI